MRVDVARSFDATVLRIALCTLGEAAQVVVDGFVSLCGVYGRLSRVIADARIIVRCEYIRLLAEGKTEVTSEAMERVRQVMQPCLPRMQR